MPERILDPEEILEAFETIKVIPSRCGGKRLMASIDAQLRHLIMLEKEYWKLKEATQQIDRVPTPDTLDDIIQILRVHNVTGKPVLQITRGKATENQLLREVLDACSNLISENKELRKYLKLATEDFKSLGKLASSSRSTLEPEYYVDYIDYDSHEWRYAKEVYAILEGGENNASRVQCGSSQGIGFELHRDCSY